MNKLHYRWLFATIVMIAFAFGSFAPLLAASSEQTETPQATVIAGGLNLRQGPGKQFGVIQVLPQGTAVTVVGRSDQRCQWVRVITAEQVQGWVAGSAAFVRLNLPCTQIPPVGQEEVPLPPSPPAPAAPVRPATGTILKDNRGGGGGKLTIENFTEADGIVALVRPEDPKRAIIAFYIRHGEVFTVGGIPNGRYHLVFTTGTEWDDGQRRFTRNERYQRFKEPGGVQDAILDFGPYNSWTATLHGVREGQHPIQPMDKAQFPDL